MKNHFRLVAILFIAVLCLTGCSAVTELGNLINAAAGASAGNRPAEANGDAENVECTIMADLDEVVEDMLNHLTREQSLDYALDESFFLWFYGKYGEDITKELERRIWTEKNSDFWRELTGNTLHVLWIYYCSDTGLYPEELANVYRKDSFGSDIVISFAGDLNFDDDWPNVQDLNGLDLGITDRMNDELLLEMRQSDILMINNEFTYGEGGTPLEGKAYTFQAHPSKVQWLTDIGADIISLANNHVYDYGAEGLLSTLKTVEQEGIPYVGAGKNLDEAKKIVYFIINGKKIAFTSATQIERTYNYTKEATEDSPGVLKTLNADKYVKVIEEARKKADYVIAFVHWGTEGRIYYQEDQKALAQKFVDAGVDVVIGGHTHCLQGFEYRDGVPIFYSLGNFWFDWDEENSKATGLAQMIIHEDGSADYRFIPCVYDEYTTYKLTLESDIEAAYEYMESISNGVKLDENGYWMKE